MNRKRVGLLGLFGLALFLAAVEPAAAQSTHSTVTEGLIWGLNDKLLYAAVPITVLVEAILFYAVWKFRKSDEAKPTQENRRLEITWTVATAIILLFVGVASYQVLGSPFVTAQSQHKLDNPGNVEHINVYGQRYVWSFGYRVDAENVNGSGLTLDNVTISGANVTNVTSDGIHIENAQLSSDTIQSATLVNGTVTGAENKTGTDVTFTNVTVESAAIDDATIKNGSMEVSTKMYVPVDRTLSLNITSRDWLHSFHVPALGLKQDAFPGKWNRLITHTNEKGEYQLYCAEYCGSGHSKMLGQVHVVSQQKYQDWKVQQWLKAHQ
ncbi:MAG: cytochrome c oxidase subunit II [Halorientalis sp.]